MKPRVRQALNLHAVSSLNSRCVELLIETGRVRLSGNDADVEIGRKSSVSSVNNCPVASKSGQ